MAYVWNHQNHPPQNAFQSAEPFPSILPPLYAAEVAARARNNVYRTMSQRGFIHQSRPLFSQLYEVTRPRSNYDPTRLGRGGLPNVNSERQPNSSSRLMVSQEDDTLMLSFVLEESINQENPSPIDGLSESMIARNLKTRDCNLVTHGDDEDKICVVCQDSLCQENEKIATLDCRHEYHQDCIGKWLLQRNFCPVCKATAISVD
ncbi:hypothetical protein ACJIZ3_011262 [Penstemon smallii]|uniref:RING-type E3 ubiquitin transferase n=1 Tax=Penstemon smallii TaxID=265156 RepID=A0ABD3UJ11_9LAMI